MRISDWSSDVCSSDLFAVEQAVLDKARLVDVPWIVGVDLVAVDVDLDKARRGDLAEMHAVRVDEVAAVLVGNLHRDMVEDHLVPAHHREDAIAGGEFLPRRPFGLAVLAVGLELGRLGLCLFVGRFWPATYATRRGGHPIPPTLPAKQK